MPNTDKPSARSQRGMLWLFLLIALLVALLLWWLSGLRPSILLTEKVAVEEPALTSPSMEPGSETDSEPLADVPVVTKPVAIPREPPIQISGRVILLRKPPEERVLSIQTNRDGTTTTIMSRDYEVSSQLGLANAFVYVESGLENRKYSAPETLLQLTETNGFLEPFMAGARVDQRIEIENSNERHQYRLISSRGAEFAWKRNEKGLMEDPLELVFSEPDVLSHLTCRAHPWEWAYFGVVAHPYFAVTDTNGYFKLPAGIPPGKYKIAVRHPKAGRQVRSIVAEKGQKYDLRFELFPQKVDPKTAEAPPVTQNEGESLEDRGDRGDARWATPSVQDGFSEGAPIIGQNSARSGVVRGRVKLSGTPPPEKPLDVIKKDAGCGRIITDVPHTRIFVTGKDAGLADTVVYLDSEELRKGRFTIPKEPLLLDQVKCQYTPYVTAIQKGQRLLVRNSDPILHNVHPIPTVDGNKESNKVQMPNAADLEFVFERHEAFLRFKCDVHPWMIAYVTVMDHPFFSVTDANGNFSITNVPPGKYQVRAMHRRAGLELLNDVVVNGGHGAEIELTLNAR